MIVFCLLSVLFVPAIISLIQMSKEGRCHIWRSPRCGVCLGIKGRKVCGDAHFQIILGGWQPLRANCPIYNAHDPASES